MVTKARCKIILICRLYHHNPCISSVHTPRTADSENESSPTADKRKRTAEPEFIDLTRSSSPIAYGSDDEADVSGITNINFRFLAYLVSLA